MSTAPPCSDESSAADSDESRGLLQDSADQVPAVADAAVKEAATLAQDLLTLWRHPVYPISVAGTSIYTGAP